MDVPDLDVPVAAGLAELAEMLRGLPPLGDWIADASCGQLGRPDVFTTHTNDSGEGAMARRVCARCPVRTDCADYASRAPVYGLWAGQWHSDEGPSRRQVAA